MRTIFTLSAIAACAIATPSFASEEDDWTGAYVGISIGYTDAKSDQTVDLGGTWASESAALQSYVTDFFASHPKISDVNFGGQLGYNYQTNGGLVIGMEADVSVLSGKDDTVRGPTPTTPFPSLTYTVANNFDPKATYGVKGKIGFASGKTLFYATGGWGWTNADIAVDITSNGGYHKTASGSHTFNGYEIGGGIEQKLGANMSVRLDYTYTDQGDYTFVTAYAPGSSFSPPSSNYAETYTQDLRMHLIRLGVNFHF